MSEKFIFGGAFWRFCKAQGWTTYGKRKDLIYEYDALRAITIHPAEHIGIADRVGSLEEGKDADIVIVDGSPFELTGVIRHVLIDGKEVK